MNAVRKPLNTVLGDLTAPAPPPLPKPETRPPGKLFAEPEAEAILESMRRPAVPLPSGETVPPPSSPAGKRRRGPSRSGTRQKPYMRDDGVEMIKQSFHATEAFDKLWRKVPGALPRGVHRNEWVEKVLARAIRSLIERGEREEEEG